MAESNKRQGFYFDQQTCIGCRTCQIACKDKNDLDVGMLFRSVLSFEEDNYPNTKIYHLSIGCNECANAACVAVCPTGAMYHDGNDGTVQHDDSKCIGCKSCVIACPYGQPKFNKATGTVHKCDACISLRAAGEQPACVASCIMRALEFGDYEKLKVAHPNALGNIMVLPDASVSDSSLLIDARKAASENDFRKITM